MTRNTLGDMHNLLMEQMERLAVAEDGSDLKAEIARAEAMTDVASQVSQNASVILRAAQMRSRQGGTVPAMLGAGEGGES